MGANRTNDYSAAVRRDENGLLFSVPDPELAPHFAGNREEPFEVRFIEQNDFTVEIPEIPNKDVLNKLK